MSLTLRALMNGLGVPASERASVRLIRHTIHSDRAIAKSNGIKPDALKVQRLLDRDDKLTALRLDSELAAAYTAEQARDVFTSNGETAERLLVFAATGSLGAEYLGTWRVDGLATYQEFAKRHKRLLMPKPKHLSELHAVSLLRGLGFTGPKPHSFFYRLERLPTFLSGFEGRLVVEWGNARNWVAKSLDVEVAEIRPAGFVRPFPGHESVDLSFEVLCAIFRSPHGNPEWKHRLDAVGGIYLIRDTQKEALYIGSASGQEGLWQRWGRYASTGGHGGNQQLKRIIEASPERARHFRWSILQVLGRETPRTMVLSLESKWKDRLGTRASLLGYNGN